MAVVPEPVEAHNTAHLDPLITDEPTRLSPLVRRVLAPNPSAMTGPGTNTYLVGSDDVTIIDPGPDDAGHVEAILAACEGKARRVICTHTHVDHWPAAHTLREATGVEVLGYGSRDGLEVNRTLGDGDEICTAEYTLRMIHTPGHASNHLCPLLVDEDLVFSGDHVMQGTTVVIAPPDGDMSQYLGSLRHLADLDPPLARIAPAHGHVIEDPAAVIDAYLQHRAMREEIVAEAMSGAANGGTVDDLVRVVYADVDEMLYPVARLSLWAHLRKLATDGRVRVDDPDDIDSAHWQAC